VKREKAEPLLEDVLICLNTGWTYEQLLMQPSKFIEKLKIYLTTTSDLQIRERKRFEEELRRLQK